MDTSIEGQEELKYVFRWLTFHIISSEGIIALCYAPSNGGFPPGVGGRLSLVYPNHLCAGWEKNSASGMPVSPTSHTRALG